MNWIRNLLFPSKCVFCHSLSGKESICPVCKTMLPSYKPAVHKRVLPSGSSCYVAFSYCECVKESFHRFKFQGCSYYADFYGSLMFSEIGAEPEVSACEYVSWIPLSRMRLRSRGYDQARLIAESLARNMGIPCIRLLIKSRNNPAQSGTENAAARKRNVEGVYRCVSNTKRYSESKILLVDDVVTTGSTLSEAVRVLKGHDFHNLVCAAFASADK